LRGFGVAGELLLELLSEEIPARMQRRAIAEFSELIRQKLIAAALSHGELRGHVTPRRLTVIIEGIAPAQPDMSEDRRGPRVGAPQPAIDGFLRAAGLGSIGQCEVRDTGRGEFYFAVIARPGQPAAEVLPGLIHDAMSELPWPKSMRYPAAALRWVRPLNSVICLLDGAILPLPLGDVPVGRSTRGHRFLSDGDIEVADAADYLARLEAAHVVLVQDRRKEIIAAELDRAAAAERLTVKPDPALLDEVTGLVEFPVVLMGAIDDASMALPPEVLATAMRTHQKYFSCLNADGTPAPRFLFVANNLTPDNGRTIVAGNERVLRARLADARFFWDQDRKVRLEDRVEALKQRVYYDKLGTMYDKAERMEKIAQQLALALNGDVARVRRAARLAKADLSTGMVSEFPELQGIMGRYYALHDKVDPRIADAIADHYRPRGPNDPCPTAPDSIIVSLADKLDTFASFFRIGERPTGSGDPFAIRRAVLGIIRIILENKINLHLSGILDFAIDPGPPFTLESEIPAQREELSHFIGDRLEGHLRGQGVRHDLIAAVLATGEDDLLRLLGRVEPLSQFLDTDDGANLLVAYRRAANIVAIEERRHCCSYDYVLPLQADAQTEESALRQALDQVADETRSLLEQAQFTEAMTALARLRQPVDEFFDKVIVNTDDANLRENRLRLLSRIRAVMKQVADFSQIEG
jgi:glycyl-tRNA synthetase beta chain